MKKKKAENVFKYVILTVLLLIYIFPFFMVLINAFKEKVDVIKAPLSLVGEHGFIFSNFTEAIEKMHFFPGAGKLCFCYRYQCSADCVVFGNGILYYGKEGLAGM